MIRIKLICIATNPTLFYCEENPMAKVRFYELFIKETRIIIAKPQRLKVLKDNERNWKPNQWSLPKQSTNWIS